MNFSCSNLYLPGSDAPKESEGVGEGIASSHMCTEAENTCDMRTINAIGLDQRCLPPVVLPHLSSPRDSIGHNIGSSSSTQVMQTASVDVAQSKAAETIVLWKKPSPRAKRLCQVCSSSQTNLGIIKRSYLGVRRCCLRNTGRRYDTCCAGYIIF